MASAAGSLSKGVKQVRPLLSLDNAEARKRVLNLYKAWYRQIPYIGEHIFITNWNAKSASIGLLSSLFLSNLF